MGGNCESSCTAAGNCNAGTQLPPAIEMSSCTLATTAAPCTLSLSRHSPSYDFVSPSPFSLFHHSLLTPPSFSLSPSHHSLSFTTLSLTTLSLSILSLSPCEGRLSDTAPLIPTLVFSPYFLSPLSFTSISPLSHHSLSPHPPSHYSLSPHSLSSISHNMEDVRAALLE